MPTLCNIKNSCATLSFQEGNKKIVGIFPSGCIVNVPSHYIKAKSTQHKNKNKNEGILIIDGKYPLIRVNEHLIVRLSEVFQILKMNTKSTNN